MRDLVDEHGNQDDTEPAGDELLPPLLGSGSGRIRGAPAARSAGRGHQGVGLAAVVVVVSVVVGTAVDTAAGS